MDDKLEKLFLGMARPEVINIKAYDTGTVPEKCIRLMANENNRGVSPAALSAMKKAVEDGSMYPDGSCRLLREKLADRYGLDSAQILVGNGLDGVFTILSRAFMSPGDEVVCAELTFSVYADNASIMGARPVIVPMADGLALDVDGFISSVTERTKMLFFCNPNNPTGTMAGRGEVVRLIESVPHNVIVVLDEAYMDFADENEDYSFALLSKHPNLIVVRTFSKIYGLAGLRAGWAAAHPALIDFMNRVREPYCVTEIAERGALAAMDDSEFYASSRAMFRGERAKFQSFCAKNKIKFITSQGNFVLLRTGNASERLAAALADGGIAVRGIAFRGENMIRMSMGLPEENEKAERIMLDALN